MSRSSSLWAVSLVALALAGAGACREATRPPVAEPEGSVWVEELARGSSVAAAGIAVGDRLIAWRRGDVVGPFDTWDDLSRLEQEQAPLGTVVIIFEREGRSRETAIPEDDWGAKARPGLDREAAETLARAHAAIAARDRATAQRLVSEIGRRPLRPADRAWAGTREASLAPASSTAASAAWESALAAAAAAADPALEAWVAVERCFDAARSGEFAPGREACSRALARNVSRGARLAALHVRTVEALLVGRQGDAAGSEERLRAVLAELEPIAPESGLALWTLRGLARSVARRDDYEGAREITRQALARVERRSPRSVRHQQVLVSLAVEEWRRDDYARAEAHLAEARAILEAIDPRHDDLLFITFNGAMVAADRGDLAFAEESYLRALDMLQERPADPLAESRIYNNLAVVAARRGDLETALSHDRRVLEIRERLTPESVDLVTPLINLGDHSERAGDPAAALRYLDRALAIQRRLAPGSHSEAQILLTLGEAQVALADPRAEATLEEARELAARVAPGSVLEARTTSALAARRAAGGRFREAEALYRRATASFARLTPGTADEALALYELGVVRRRAGDPPGALAALRAAASALDRQFGTLGGTDEMRARFRESWRRVYDELADLLRELGRAEEAFQVLERARARAFLHLVRARQIDLTASLPTEIGRERRELERAFASVSDELEGASNDAVRTDELLARRRDLLRRRDRLAERAYQASPRLAELDAAFDVDAARTALGDGVTAISYAVDESTTRAWIVGPKGQFEVVDLGVGEAQLRDLVDRFRLLLETRSEATDPGPLSERLHALLVSPWAARINTPSLLVVPDGPLHHLPFGALRQPPDGAVGSTEGRFFVEWKPYQVASSISAWAELARRRTSVGGGAVSFADPSPEPRRAAGAVERRWGRLPYGRREARRVAELVGEGAYAYVGDRATEAAAKKIGRGTRFVHFATHAWVDTKSPLDSALILAPSRDGAARGEDGLLAAWEVLQELDLDAALVVLSGCETGSGALVADEGLLGLTRSFQFAGARAVVASLWPVPDAGTARLMDRFYRRLVSGEPADRALRSAQLELIRSGSHAHPSSWAAFQIYGAAGERPR